MDFTTAAQLLALCQEGSVTLGEAMLRREMDLTGASREEIMARLERSLEIMEQAAAAALAAPQKTKYAGRPSPWRPAGRRGRRFAGHCWPVRRPSPWAPWR